MTYEKILFEDNNLGSNFGLQAEMGQFYAGRAGTYSVSWSLQAESDAGFADSGVRLYLRRWGEGEGVGKCEGEGEDEGVGARAGVECRCTVVSDQYTYAETE